MFENFTDRARKVMAMANQEAIRLHHSHIETAHILLGLIKEGSGVGAGVLRSLEINLPKLKSAIEKGIKVGDDDGSLAKLPQTPRAKMIIEFAIGEAKALKHDHVGTEHLLLGMLRESGGAAGQSLRNLGLTVELVRESVVGPVAQRSAKNGWLAKLFGR